MSATTYQAAHTAPASLPAATPPRRKGLFSRIMEARQRQAMQELSRHGLRLPRELEEAGLKISERNEDSLPFVR
jgi:predicted nuclease with RNAse H fold